MEHSNETGLENVVGWAGEGAVYCPDHVDAHEAREMGMQPLTAHSKGWEDITCDVDDSKYGGIHTLGQVDNSPRPDHDALLETIVKEAVKKGISAAMKESAKPKVRVISQAKLAEGVRKALRMVLKESVSQSMPGGSMPPPGAGAGAPQSAPTTEENYSADHSSKGSSTFGGVPSPEELQSAIDEEGGWEMDLRGEDLFAFEYAVEVAGLGYPNMNSGEGMHKVLNALSTCPAPDELPETVPDEEIEDPHSKLNRTLDSWGARYGRGGKKIEDAAQSLASGILGVLGWEWI